MNDYITVSDLKQGNKVAYKDETIMKLPNFVECYGEKANFVNLKTGTMLYISESKRINKDTLKIED